MDTKAWLLELFDRLMDALTFGRWSRERGECSLRIELRIRQAIRRADLGNLLVPALDDLERMVSNVIDAKAQVCAALEKME